MGDISILDGPYSYRLDTEAKRYTGFRILKTLTLGTDVEHHWGEPL